MKEGFYSLEPILGRGFAGRLGGYLYVGGELIHCYEEPKVLTGEEKARMLDILESNQDCFLGRENLTFNLAYTDEVTGEERFMTCEYSYEYKIEEHKTEENLITLDKKLNIILEKEKYKKYI